MPITVTNPRVGRATNLYFGLGSKGSAVSAFGSHMEAFFPAAEIAVSPLKTDENWPLETAGGPNTSERVNIGDKFEGTIRCHATPASAEYLLRSNFGTFAGGAFTLTHQPTEWLTLGWRENSANSAGNLVRLWDAWVHRLSLRFSLRSIAEFVAEYAAESVTIGALPVGGVTYPSSVDKNVFAGATGVFVRDPASANVSLRLYDFEITLNQGLFNDWDTMRGLFTVYKTGPLVASCRFRSTVSDETWTLLTNSRAGTKQRFRATLTAPSPAKTLQFDMYEMDFVVEALGRDGRGHVDFVATGKPHVSGSNFVAISLS